MGLTPGLKGRKTLMLEKLKSLFTNPKKDEPMAATTSTTSTPTRQSGKVCSTPGGVEQLSATSDSGDDNDNNLCENAVRERAYLLWEKAGYPGGDGVNFWIDAETELKAEAEAV